MKAQGDVREIPVAKFTYDYLAKNDGKVIEIDNKKLSQTCRLAGAPENKVAGLYLYKHLNDSVKKGEKVFTIHSNSKGELEQAIKFVEENELYKIK